MGGVVQPSGRHVPKLPESEKMHLTRARALELMLAQPSLIKRPVLETADALIVGFSPERYAAVF